MKKDRMSKLIIAIVFVTMFVPPPPGSRKSDKDIDRPNTVKFIQVTETH